jgi:hypothetical protein
MKSADDEAVPATVSLYKGRFCMVLEALIPETTRHDGSAMASRGTRNQTHVRDFDGRAIHRVSSPIEDGHVTYKQHGFL